MRKAKHPKPKPESLELKLFKNAEAYRYSCVLLARSRSKSVLFPKIVLLAFAFELYLKSLMVIERGSYKQGHALDKLFFKLGRESQAQIETDFYRILDTDAYQIQKYGLFSRGLGHLWIEDFDNALRLSARAFERFRYIHENPGDANWWASPIAERNRILTVRPDWKIYALGRNRKATFPAP